MEKIDVRFFDEEGKPFVFHGWPGAEEPRPERPIAAEPHRLRLTSSYLKKMVRYHGISLLYEDGS